MKYKEIKLDNNKSVLVDESAEIKEGYFLDGEDVFGPFEVGDTLVDNKGQIKATINHSISLDVPMVIIEDEVEKLAKVKGLELYVGGNYDFENGVRVGFRLSQQKGVYSEADLRKAYEAGESSKEDEINGDGEIGFIHYIQSLNQEYIELEMFDVECSCKSKEDMSKCSINCCKSNSRDFPRIKTDRVNGQLMAYVYEKI